MRLTLKWSRAMRHSAKNKYINADAAQKAAAKYTRTKGFIYRFYECDFEKCGYFHLTTVTHNGIQVLSLEALRKAND
jgi:hypothetical protein